MKFLLLLIISCSVMMPTLVQARIAGGSKLKAPWIVRIALNGNTHCTGSLITPQWVITAAHCFYQQNFDLSLLKLSAGGDGSLASLKPLPNIARIFLHPKYQGHTTVPKDVALIQLAAPVKTSESLQPIALRDVSSFYHLPDVDVHIAGWGSLNGFGVNTKELRGFSTRIFRTLDMPVARSEGAEILTRQFKSSHILAYLNTNQLTCGGDSGTGWMINLADEGPRLIAIHSQGDCQSFGAAAELSGVLPWIRRTIGL